MENQITIQTLYQLYLNWLAHKVQEHGAEYMDKPVTWGDLGGFIKWAKLSYEESAKQAEKEFKENPFAFLQKAFGDKSTQEQ